MKNHLIILSGLLLFISCETIVDIDVPRESPRLVLNSFFNPDSTLKAEIYESQFVLDNGDFKTIPGAAVIISDENGNEVAKLNDQGNGIYESDFKPETGTEYIIQASKQGYETVTGKDMIPSEPAAVTSIHVASYRNQDGGTENEITFTINDENGNDFYEILGMIEFTYTQDSLTYSGFNRMFFFSDDPVFSDFNSSGSFLLFNDVLFEGKEREIKVSTFFQYPRCSIDCSSEAEINFYVRKVSKQYFDYRQTLELQQSLEGDPFAEPVSVYNNIENGYGIFAGFQTSTFLLDEPEEVN